MFEVMVEGKTLPEAYHNALRYLNEYGTITDCEYQTETCKQKEVSMTMVVGEPLAEPMISRLWIGGAYDLERYRQEMLDGALDCMINHGWDYTYHDRMVNFPTKSNIKDGIDQIQFVIDELRRCPDSRRAVISIRSEQDIDVKAADPACLQHIQYFVRGGKLHCKVLFRSNDACEATFMNAWALIMIQKNIADKLGVEMGTYTHRANSFHCYEKDFDLLDGYINRIESGENLTFDYDGEFDEMMEEEKPNVETLFNQLKSKIDDVIENHFVEKN